MSAPCDGCKKPVKFDDDKPVDGLYIDGFYPGRKHHLLHRGRHRDRPSEACLAKLRGALDRCVGCGDDTRWDMAERDGFLCKACRGHLARATEVPEAAKLGWYMVDTYGMSEGDDYRKNNDLFGELLVKAVQREGRIGGAHAAWTEGKEGVLSTNGRNSSDTHSGMPAVELTKAQAKAVLELMRWMRKTLASNFRAGVEQGHSALVRLARGEVSPQDYEGQKASDLKEE